jgi:GDPmannose 4,6-dehydratase
MLLGDPSKAKEQLGWEPEYAISELVEDMVTKDFKNCKLL